MNLFLTYRKTSLFLLLGVSAAILLWIGSCAEQNRNDIDEVNTAKDENKEVIARWNELWLEVERNTDGFRPPVAARSFAYTSIAAYESALPENTNYQSIYRLLAHKEVEKVSTSEFITPLSLNAAYATMFKKFFTMTKKQSWQKIIEVEQRFYTKFSKNQNSNAIHNSVTFGKNIAENIWQWAAEDKIGIEGHVQNYHLEYQHSEKIGDWQPDADHPMLALLPYWGKSRPFVMASDELLVNPPIPYSEETSSAYYKQALEIYTLSKPISKENKWISEFWSDDISGLTFTPPTHWVSICNQLLRQKDLKAAQELELYAKLGIALSDAAVVCWNSKYHYNVERPKQYIRRVINPTWDALHDNPSFPSYPSGHAMFGAAAAAVLNSFFGDTIDFWDKSHEHRTEFLGQPRHFNSLEKMASENAYSRMALGVHSRMDCEEGLRYGKLTGQKVANMSFFADNH
jgi:PAP2 superfamily